MHFESPIVPPEDRNGRSDADRSVGHLGIATVTSAPVAKFSDHTTALKSDVISCAAFDNQIPQPNQSVSPFAVKTEGISPQAETLLIVEDEADVRHLAVEVLEAVGYRVLRATNGLEALRVARENTGAPISLVVSDVIMPQMNGKVMAEWLQTIAPDLKVLYTSGYSDDAIASQGILDPGVAYLPKPYTSSSLTRKVREVLDNS